MVVSLMLLAMLSVSASNGFQGEKMSASAGELNQFQNQFQNRFNFTGEGNWSYKEKENNSYAFEYKHQRKFLFFNVEEIEEYEVNELGEIVREKKNFWARVFGRDEE